MIKVFFKILVMGTILLSANYDVQAASVDKDGCFKTPRNCVAMSSKWKKKRFISYYTNNCGARIYIRFCNKRAGKTPDCGASGLKAGKRKAWHTSRNATSQYYANWVGSVKGSKDWVCSGKVRGWKDVR